MKVLVIDQPVKINKDSKSIYSDQKLYVSHLYHQGGSKRANLKDSKGNTLILGISTDYIKTLRLK